MIAQQRLILIAGSLDTKNTLTEQLDEIIGDFVQIESYALDNDQCPMFEQELILLSSTIIEGEAEPYIGEGCTVLVAKRIMNFLNIEKLLLLKEGESVLYVNDFPETVQDSLESVKKLGIDHLTFLPYYPGKSFDRNVKVAVTPGELGLVPPSIETVINIGPRLLDMSTLLTILRFLNILESKQDDVSNRYIRTIIRLSQKLRVATNESNKFANHLRHVVDGVNDGILAVRQGMITVMNDVTKKILHLSSDQTVGRQTNQVIRERQLLHFLHQHEKEADLLTIHGQEIMVQRLQIENEGTTVLTLKNVSETAKVEREIRRELRKKGHIAKYGFDDIIGQSPNLVKTKEIAKKLAKTELTILIEGESGTGKELFASAIHRESVRRDGPFLAVNFSALPEDLVESELFGYEEGAFTGAKKGGRKGLFEQANGGTIFLDEIGDISLKVQARLLRVLQERELLRIGGSQIIPIDVRVVAATNKNLLELIQKGSFREDLYHRLKVLYVHLPALRFRKRDIPLLVSHFLKENGRGDLIVEQDVLNLLQDYPWYGNIREIKNTIDYMVAVSEEQMIRVEDIPDEHFFQRKRADERPSLSIQEESSPSFDLLETELLFILEAIFECQQQGASASRKKIAEKTETFDYPLSEQQIRQRLETMEEQGYVKKHRGRLGTRLTKRGIDYLDRKKTTY